MSGLRRLVVGVLVACVLSAGQAHAAYRYLKFGTVAVAGTAIGFTAADIAPSPPLFATIAVCRLETAQIRYTIDTTTPTASVGVLWEVGEEKTFNGQDVLSNFRGIRTGGTSGQLDCHYAAP